PDPPADPGPNPNILLLISDDVGLDASSGYTVGAELPNTPTLDALAANGLIFDNAWANPVCSPTRATILSGRYGYRTGVLTPGDDISLNETSLQQFIDTNVPNTYEHGVFGKWHLAGNSNGGDDNPNLLGVDHYDGLSPNAGGVGDYFSWQGVENGQSSQQSTYTTTEFVDDAIGWIANRQNPWFAWVAFNAPHTPFHLPPIDLHARGALPDDQNSIDSDPLTYYLTAIEAMDSEISRLLSSFSTQTRDSTIVIYIGDNGTPGQVGQTYGMGRTKGSIYQGGVNVPLIISGAGVSRQGEREDALVQSVDLYATIANVAGSGTQEINDSKNFSSLFSAPGDGLRNYSYTDGRDLDTYTIRNARYKLVHDGAGAAAELYDLNIDPYEQNDISGDPGSAAILTELQTQADMVRQ
ncbi:MAG: sulfatase-like hydrolase/transferase, partial [Gammaproteobacteria bacterium]